MSEEDQLLSLFVDENRPKEKSEEALVSLPAQTKKEELQIEQLHINLERLKEENEGLKQDRKQRKIFGYCIFAFLCFYMIITLGIVISVGFFYAYLSDKVLITLLTTSLASVIGIFKFVAKYLFPSTSNLVTSS